MDILTLIFWFVAAAMMGFVVLVVMYFYKWLKGAAFLEDEESQSERDNRPLNKCGNGRKLMFPSLCFFAYICCL